MRLMTGGKVSRTSKVTSLSVKFKSHDSRFHGRHCMWGGRVVLTTKLPTNLSDRSIGFVGCSGVRLRTQLRWSKAALRHEARTVMSRHHSDDGGGFVTTVFVHQVDVTAVVFDCTKTTEVGATRSTSQLAYALFRGGLSVHRDDLPLRTQVTPSVLS